MPSAGRLRLFLTFTTLSGVALCSHIHVFATILAAVLCYIVVLPALLHL